MRILYNEAVYKLAAKSVVSIKTDQVQRMRVLYNGIAYIRTSSINWSKATQEQLATYAIQNGDGFSHLINKDTAKLYNWKFIPNFHLSQFIKTKYLNLTTTDMWVNWYEGEIRHSEDSDKDSGYFDELEKEWKNNPLEVGPILLMKKNGAYGIGDGNHRIGISFKLGIKTIPAIVGVPKMKIASYAGSAWGKPGKCKYCKEPATKNLIWADGRAGLKVCNKHTKDGRDEIEKTDKVCEVVKIAYIGVDPMSTDTLVDAPRSTTPDGPLKRLRGWLLPKGRFIPIESGHDKWAVDKGYKDADDYLAKKKATLILYDDTTPGVIKIRLPKLTTEAMGNLMHFLIRNPRKGLSFIEYSTLSGKSGYWTVQTGSA